MSKAGAQVVVLAAMAAMVGLAIYLKTRHEEPGRKTDDGKNGAGAGRELLLLCGGSFRLPAEKLARAFEEETGAKVTLSFGQSEDLLPQIKLGKQGDALISHDPYGEYVEKAGALSRHVVVGHLSPALVVRNGNPKNVKSLEDLARPDVRACLPDPKYSTCGEMLAKLLEKKGIREAVEKNAGNAVFRTHAQTCNAIAMDSRDAGVAWNGVAFNFRESVEVVPTPYEYGVEVRVLTIGLNYSKNAELLEKFLAFAEKRGPAIFKEHGYVK